MATRDPEPRYTAFEGLRRLASGHLPEVGLAVKAAVEGGASGDVSVFEDHTGRVVDFDLRGTADEVRKRLAAGAPGGAAPGAEVTVAEQPERRGPGRPRLGVVGREVTLLPRHWQWLAAQPGGASVTLRKLVDQARRATAGASAMRDAREAAYRFMSHMAGNLPGFEEAARALFAGQAEKFERETERWPADVRDYARRLAEPSFERELR